MDSSIVRYTENHGLASNKVRTISIDNNGVKWFGTGRSVSRFDGINWIYYPFGYPSNHPSEITSSFVGDNNSIWFGAGFGVYKIDGIDWKLIIRSSTNKIIKDNNGTIWVIGGNWAVNYDINGNILNSYDSPYGDEYFCVAVDSNSVLWVGGKLYVPESNDSPSK